MSQRSCIGSAVGHKQLATASHQRTDPLYVHGSYNPTTSSSGGPDTGASDGRVNGMHREDYVDGGPWEGVTLGRRVCAPFFFLLNHSCVSAVLVDLLLNTFTHTTR